jgi:hypothetical protein
MPSNKDPNLVVVPGPGRLPADSVPASALTFVTGGSGTGLAAHINNPINAHFATAIGLNPVHDPLGQNVPLLSSAGGPFDGQNVEDAISQLAALLPTRPNVIGFDNGTNGSFPTWTNLGGSAASLLVGGYTDASNVVFTKFLVATGVSTFTITGTVYPADRGIISIYTSPTGDFSQATLYAALWLGSGTGPQPGTIASANFNETLRATAPYQSNYTASGAGLDKFSLTSRVPYLASYTGTSGSGVFTNYNTNFPAYQLARYTTPGPITLSSGAAGSFIIVHWKETVAPGVINPGVQPFNLTPLLTSTNCYSAVPTGSDYDGVNIRQVNRKNVYRDANSGTPPAGNSFTTAIVGSPTQIQLSGVPFYSNSPTGLIWNVAIKFNTLFRDSYLTGTAPNGAIVPSGYTSANNPLQIDLTDFGQASLINVPYNGLRKDQVGSTAYSNVNAPGITDVALYENASLSITGASPAAPVTGYGVIKTIIRDPFQTANYDDSANRFMFNSFPQSGGGAASTDTFETFVDEQYRHVSTYNATTPTTPIVPAGADDFNSAATLVASSPDLQVMGGRLVYPQTDFSTNNPGVLVYSPAGPNYASVLSSDPSNHLRRYIRAFNTGIARNTGRLRIKGTLGMQVTLSGPTVVLPAPFYTDGSAYNGSETTGHRAGAMIHIKVPGVTGWMDLGRTAGDPSNSSADFFGCRTTVDTSVAGEITVGYNTIGSTAGSGGANGNKFLIYVRVTLIKSAGVGYYADEIQWLA